MIENNLKIVKNKIAESCYSCNRELSEIKLIAVSKTRPISDINTALNHGLSNFGENKALELRDKANLIESDINWHFIGHLQTNKAKYVIPFADIIHSVDSIKLVSEVNKIAARQDKIQNILLEFNTSKEESKFGLTTFEEGLELFEYCSGLKHVKVSGLMTMAPYSDNEILIRSSFSTLKNYFEKMNSRGYKLRELSMGMSNDYQIAIEEGSTMLRIGSAIFGNRNYL